MKKISNIIVAVSLFILVPIFANVAYSASSTHSSNFLKYLEMCDVNGIKRTIMKGADTKLIFNSDFLPWIFTVRCSDPLVITEIIKSGVNVNAVPKGTITASMYTAASSYDRGIFNTIIDAGANTVGTTPLMIAAIYNANHHIFSKLIQAGADVNMRDNDGLTPLMFAAGNTTKNNVISELIKSGADVNTINRYGITPLMEAAEKNTTSIAITELIKAGADVNAKDKNGLTPMIIAAGYNHPQHGITIITELIKAGADVNAQDNEGLSSLDYAKIKNRHLGLLVENKNELISLLIKSGAK